MSVRISAERFFCAAAAACLLLGPSCGEEKPPLPVTIDGGTQISDGGNILDPEDGSSPSQLGAPCDNAGDCELGLICYQGHCFDTTNVCGRPDIDNINAGNQDSDCDGLSDIEEFSARFFVGGQWLRSDPGDPDTDGDGILDGVEMGRMDSPDPCCLPYFTGDADPLTTTVPVNADSDGDGIIDGREDTNRDGKFDVGETDPNKTDSDSDGLSDSSELNGLDLNGASHGYGPTNPAKADTDGDGCLDGTELIRGTNPNNPGDCSGSDTDGDGLSDDHEALLGTDPTKADTDGDGLNDGDEINVHHTDPTKADTDGDGLNDGDEVNTHHTNPNKPDTDGDGLSDGQEVRLGTNPNKKDTDGDSCEDGYEIQYAVQFGLDPTNPRDCPPAKTDADCDGLTDAEEAQLGTNPRNKDSDGDGLWDGYEVGVTFNPDPLNCPQADFLAHVYNPTGAISNPAAKDSDGDGLSDGDEINTHHTDPMNPDSDGDGLNDGAEIAAGTNPAKPDSDSDGIPDGAEVIGGLNPLNPSDGQSGVVNQACAKPREILVHRSKSADISLVTPKTFTKTSVLKVGSAEKGLMAYDSTNKVAAFAFELTSSESTIVAQETAGRTKVGGVSALSSALTQTFTSWDKYPAAIGYYEQSDSSTDLLARANAIVKAFLGSSASGTLSGTAGVKGPFKMQIEYLHRKDSSKTYRTIVVGAIVATSTASSNETALLEMTDTAGGSALAQFGDNSPLACEKVTSSGNSAVDFIWVVDYSYSMGQWQSAVAAAADEMANQLNNAPVDWRVAVIYHDTDRPSGQSTQPRLNSPHGFTTNINEFKNWVTVTANGLNPERMFAPVKQMLEHESTTWLPASTPVNANKLRKGAKVSVVWLSDANEQSIWGGICDAVGKCNTGSNSQDCISGVSCPYSAPNNPARLATTAEWINYFTNLPGSMGKAFVAGIVPPVGVNLNAEEKVGSAYRDVITALGGIEMDIQNTNSFSQGISQIITSAVGQATSTKLKKPPVAASIKVAVSATTGSCNKADVPRSRTNGFDFDGVNQTLVFYGGCRPTNGAQIAVSYRYWDDLTGPNPTYRDPIQCTPPLVANALGTACVCSDCGGCSSGLSCNRSSCSCECPADCNGACSGNLSCDTSSCGCVCDISMSCGGGRVWSASDCDCVCPGGTTSCPDGRFFSQATCSCECSVSCGPNEILDRDNCTCGCASQGTKCPDGYTFDDETCSCACDMSQIDCSQLEGSYVPDSNRCGCVCEKDCGGTCQQDEYCNPALCACVHIGFN